MPLSDRFRRLRFREVPGWGADDSREAFLAFSRCAERSLIRPYRTGALGVEAASFAAAYRAALERDEGKDPQEFFERWFRPFHVQADSGAGFVTGFYEPILPASPVRSPVFRFPLYRRPDDLVEIEGDAARPPGFDPSLRFARADGARLSEYFDRAAIEDGALEGRGLEIAWLADRFDAFLVHVQGAARLVFPGGESRRVTYAAKSGHPFTGPGRVLVELGELAAGTVTLQAIREWFRAHPERLDEILRRNRSFIFFREAPVDDPELGPVAAAKVPLTPGRSIAVDRELHTFGTPIFVHAPTLRAFGERPFRRLMIAQDTGSAIVGPARGDLFAGSGAAAESVAGVVSHPAVFYTLIPKALMA